MRPADAQAWQTLARLSAALPATLDASHPFRAPAGALPALAGVQVDLARQRVTRDVTNAFEALAESLPERIKAMLAGEPINHSEQRAVLHAALRGGAPNAPAAVNDAVAATLTRMHEIADAVRTGVWRGYSGKPITDVVQIGIGGSHLGPELAVRALAGHAVAPQRIHFVVNIDSADLQQTLRPLNPETTLFIIASKSFGTLETRVNAQTARSWFLERTQALDGLPRHFIAVSTNVAAAADFGLPEENLLPLWDWVGGRFSLWSAIGLPILLSLGSERFQQFLDGARTVDEHLASAPVAGNVPALLGLLGIWNTNFLGAQSHAILCYDERLALLPQYLQQLEMESNGKSVQLDGNAVDYQTMPILWGGVGTQGQHAYHQLLHQGTRAFTADFVLVGHDPDAIRSHHDWLLANALAQGEAFANGFVAPEHEPYRNVRGQHACTTLVLDELGPRQLGALLAIYEHKVFCQGVLWNINSFDQWGVELGKRLAVPVYEQLSGQTATAHPDAATQQLLDILARPRSPS